MKQEISTPIGIAIGVIVVIALIAFLCKQFVFEHKITPEETRAAMQKHMTDQGGH